tara:strand:- start:515 stop:1030 length:516 start_codon:yes stop_codon:yes gene_type:complete
LEIQGINVGERWERVAQVAEQTMGQHFVVLTAPYPIMALSREGRHQVVQTNLTGWQLDANEGMAQGQTGVAMALYFQGGFAAFLHLMQQLHFEALSLRARHAHKHICLHLMLDAALLLDDFPLFKTLLKERLVNSFMNASAWQCYLTMAQQVDEVTQPQVMRSMLRQGLPV